MGASSKGQAPNSMFPISTSAMVDFCELASGELKHSTRCHNGTNLRMIRKAFEGMHPLLQVIFFGSMIFTGMAIAAFTGIAVVALTQGWTMEHVMKIAGEPASHDGFWTNIAVNSANQLIAFGGAALAFGWLFGRTKLDGMGFAKPHGSFLGWAAVAVAGTLCCAPLLDLSYRLNTWGMEFLPPTLRESADYLEQLAAETTQAMLSFPGASASGAVLIAVAFLPALCEELAFRSVYQPLFVRSTKRLHLGIWIGAAFFSAIHMQFQGFIPRMLIGGGLGYLVVWSGSIWPAVIGHFVNNAGTILQAKIYGREWIESEMQGITPWEKQDYLVALGCAVGIGLTVLAMRKLAPWSQQAQRYLDSLGRAANS